ncbi:hypothetical protein GCM10023340_23800 [Nocardioides marinquilinus]|uniref:Zinc metalloprotease n=2 Tax=Nocardioides marinquilinus TaxID=1210400 RepID=A0ABP9PU21_9ACTN
MGAEVRLSPSCLLIIGLLAVAIAPRAEAVAPGSGGAAYALGALVGVAVYVAVLLHEAAHLVVARRYGQRVISITLGALGGRTAIKGEAHTPREEALTAAAGPAVSLLLGLVFLGLHATVDDGGSIALAFETLVLVNLVVGLVDLVPAPPLDGGRVVRAIAWALLDSRRRGAIAAAWVGRGLAVLVLLAPLVREPVLGTRPGTVDFVVCAAVAALVWLASSAQLGTARMLLEMGEVALSDFLRPLLTVDPDVPLAEALRRQGADGAGGVATLGSDGTLRLVDEAAVEQVPTDRRPWVPTSSVATGTENLVLPLAATGDDLMTAIFMRPAASYLLARPDGVVAGVVRIDDIDPPEA